MSTILKNKSLLSNLLITLFLTKLIFIIWSFNKGLDLTDEGWFLLNLNFPEEDKTAFTSFHLLLTSHLPFINFNIYNVRIFRLISELCSTLILVNSVIFYLNRNKSLILLLNHILFINGVVLLGFYTSAFSRNIGYFEFSNHLINVIFSFILILMVRKNMLLSFLIGVLITWLFLTKFSSGILMVILCLFFYYIYIKPKVSHYLIFLFGIMLSFFLFLKLNCLTLANWASDFERGLRFASLLGYSTTDLIINKYLGEGAFLLSILVIQSILFKTINKYYSYVIAAIFLLLACLIFKENINFLSHITTSKLFYVSVFIFYLFSFEILLQNKTLMKSPLLLLLILPFIGIVGSDTLMSINFFSNLYPLLLFIAINIFNKINILKPIMIIVIVTSTYFCFNNICAPYRLGSNMFCQTEKVESYYGEHIYVTKERKKLIAISYQKFENVKRPFPLVAKYDLPGLVYFIGAFSPITPWYFSGESQQFNNECISKIRTPYHDL